MAGGAYDSQMPLEPDAHAISAGATTEHLRLLARVARMYHERGLKQQQIAVQLGLSQARVSRLLKEAGVRGIVRSIVVLPDGVHTDLEDALQDRFGLDDAVVVDLAGSADANRALGTAAAAYLDTCLVGADVVGVSSWSGALVAAVEAMRPRLQQGAEAVVQMFGGVGDPAVQVKATRLTGRLADVLRAKPMYMPSPAIVGSAAIRRAMAKDPAIGAVMEAWNCVTVSLVGIGTIDPSALLSSSGNALNAEEIARLRSSGAVGDICLRYFDAAGASVASDVDGRLMGMSAAAIRAVPRRIAIAGGMDKVAAIRGALAGGWVSALVVDAEVASALVSA